MFFFFFSRAIMTYLVNQYGNNGRMDSLYPKEAKARASVDQRLYFDQGTMYQSFADYYVSIKKKIKKKRITNLLNK